MGLQPEQGMNPQAVDLGARKPDTQEWALSQANIGETPKREREGDMTIVLQARDHPRLRGTLGPMRRNPGARTPESPDLGVRNRINNLRGMGLGLPIELPENLRLCTCDEYVNDSCSGTQESNPLGETDGRVIGDVHCASPYVHSVIIANILKAFNLKELYWFLQEAEPITSFRNGLSNGSGSEILRSQFVNYPSAVRYLIKKPDLSVADKRLLTVADGVSIFRGDYKYFTFDYYQAKREFHGEDDEDEEI